MNYVSFGHGSQKLVILPGLYDGLTTVRGKALLLAKPYKRFLDQFTIWMFIRKNELPKGYAIHNMADDRTKVIKAIGLGTACVMRISQVGMNCSASRDPTPEDG